jgi:predicted Zn-dependent peptidase
MTTARYPLRFRIAPVAVIAVLLSLATFRPASAAPPLSLPISEHRLPNGLRVVLAPDASFDDVTVLVRYEAGAADDPMQRAGLAHVVEHLMFGRTRHDPGGYWGAVERIGAWNVNAETTLDDTRYYLTVPPDQLPIALWLESERMGFFAEDFEDEAAVRREMAIVTDEEREGAKDAAVGGVGREGLAEAFPIGHPYHRAFAAHSLGDIAAADVREFIDQWYTPKNARLVVVGHFDPTTALSLATQYFGDLPANAPPARKRAAQTQAATAVQVEMGASIVRPFVLVLWPSPPWLQPGDPELDLAATILTDPFGRLQRELVANGLAVSVWSNEQSHLRGSAFLVGATVASEKSIDEVVTVIERVVGDVARQTLPDECVRVRSELSDMLLMSLETSLGRAQRLAAPMPGSWGLSTYAAIQPSAVEHSLRAILAGPETVVVVRPDGRFSAGGEIVGRKVRRP